MVDDYGPEGMRAEVEERLGHALPGLRAAAAPGDARDHLGVHAQKQDGLSTSASPSTSA